MKAISLLFGLSCGLLVCACTCVRQTSAIDTAEPIYYAQKTQGTLCRADCDFGERQTLLEISYDGRRESLLSVSACKKGTLRLSLLTMQSLSLMNILCKDGAVYKEQLVPGNLPFSAAQIVNDCLLCSASEKSIRQALPAGWKLKRTKTQLDLLDENATPAIRITRKPDSCLIENFSFRYTVRSTILDGGTP